MSFTETIEKASGVTKAAIFLIVVIGSAFVAYNKIGTNESAIISIKEKEVRDKELLQDNIKESEKNIEKELLLQSSRADKRYTRALKIAEDHEKRLRKIEETLNYIKGKEGY